MTGGRSGSGRRAVLRASRRLRLRRADGGVDRPRGARHRSRFRRLGMGRSKRWLSCRPRRSSRTVAKGRCSQRGSRSRGSVIVPLEAAHTGEIGLSLRGSDHVACPWREVDWPRRWVCRSMSCTTIERSPALAIADPAGRPGHAHRSIARGDQPLAGHEHWPRVVSIRLGGSDRVQRERPASVRATVGREIGRRRDGARRLGKVLWSATRRTGDRSA